MRRSIRRRKSYPSVIALFAKTILNNWYFSIALHREITNDIAVVKSRETKGIHIC